MLLNYLYLNHAWEITLKQTPFKLGFLITDALLFQVYATGNLKASKATHSPTLSMSPGGHLILHRGLKKFKNSLNSKNWVGKNEKNEFHWGQLFFHRGAKQKFPE